MMTMIAKNFARFSTVLVALGLMLGLAVTGCSSTDHDGGSRVQLATIAYQFAQLENIEAKANLSVDTVVLNAYDSAGHALAAKQAVKKVADHKDVTPAGYVGATIWEGAAQVDIQAVNLVLVYLDSDGNTVGTPDILTQVQIKAGASFDFTATEEPVTGVNWEPENTAQSLALGQTLTISAKDEAENELNVKLTTAAEDRVAVDDNVVTALSPTDAGMTADVTAVAIDGEGNVIDTIIYKFTVTEEAIEVIWTPAEAAQTIYLDKGLTVSAQDNNGNNLTVELSAESSKVRIVDDNRVEAQNTTRTGETAIVNAIAKDGNGTVIGTMTYYIAVELVKLTWDPAPGPLTMHVGDTRTVTAKDDEGHNYEVRWDKIIGYYVSAEDDTMTAEYATPSEEPAYVRFKAIHSSGETITIEYDVTVIE